MVEEQIRARGLYDEAVLAAMLDIPREAFVPGAAEEEAYDDKALPLSHGQTISQPFIVAYMTAQLRVSPEHVVLEIGTGSGYQTAILSRLAKQVCSIERIEELSRRAGDTLCRLGITNVDLRLGDGTLGWAEHGPFDRIMVTAAARRIPSALVEQLRVGGRMILPVGKPNEQTLISVDRHPHGTSEVPLLACRFVRLVDDGQAIDPRSAPGAGEP